MSSRYGEVELALVAASQPIAASFDMIDSVSNPLKMQYEGSKFLEWFWYKTKTVDNQIAPGIVRSTQRVVVGAAISVFTDPENDDANREEAFNLLDKVYSAIVGTQVVFNSLPDVESTEPIIPYDEENEEFVTIDGNKHVLVSFFEFIWQRSIERK